MPKKKEKIDESPTFTFIFVISILMTALALIIPDQFKQFVDAIYSVTKDYLRVVQVVVVLILVGVGVYFLKRSERI